MGAEIPSGAVLVARAITNSSLWTMRAADRILAITCICMANWKPKKWFDGSQSTEIQRGQFVTSYENLAEAAKLSIRNVRTSLKNLEKVGFLTRRVTQRWTLVTICKYDHYQDFSKYYDTKTDNQLTNDRQTTDKSLTNDCQQLKKDNKENKEKNEKHTPEGVAQRLYLLWKDGPGSHVGPEYGIKAIQDAIHVGVSPKDIEQAFWDHAAIKGRKIWEVLDPLRQPADKSYSMQDVIEEARRKI